MDLLGIFDRGFWLFRSINTQPFLQLLILTRPVLQEKKNVLEVHFLLSGLHRYWPPPGGGGVLPYMGHMGMCRCEGYGFQAVYFRIGHINQSIWV